MNEVIPEKGPASSKERRETYLKNGPEMVKWLEGLGFKAVYARGYPDYYPERSGGCAEGRCVESDLFDPRLLGKQWKDKVQAMPVPMRAVEARNLPLFLRTWSGFSTTMDIILIRTILWRLVGRQRVSMGGALIGQLLKISLDRSVSVWLNTPLVSLITEGDAVVGVTAKKRWQGTYVSGPGMVSYWLRVALNTMMPCVSNTSNIPSPPNGQWVPPAI